MLLMMGIPASPEGGPIGSRESLPEHITKREVDAREDMAARDGLFKDDGVLESGVAEPALKARERVSSQRDEIDQIFEEPEPV